MLRAFTLAAPAKINLILEIQGRRPDGYHSLKTVMHTLALSDSLAFRPRPDGLKVTCSHPGVPMGEGNLVFRAARELARRLRREPRVHIHIRKKIPVAAGLGGGSSDAAAALRGLSRWWGRPDYPGLSGLARTLGSDVPFFLTGGCALGTGRGDHIHPWPEAVGLWILLVNPGFHLSTARVYKKTSLRLTRKKACINMMRQAVRDKNAIKIGQNLFNHLASVVEPEHPVVSRIRQDLLKGGALGAMLSGSGPTVFGLFHSRGQARNLQRQLADRYPVCLLTRTSGSVAR